MQYDWKAVGEIMPDRFGNGLQNFKKMWFDEEWRLAIQENNKAGEKVTECNTNITCSRI